jgi:hypothetical protein
VRMAVVVFTVHIRNRIFDFRDLQNSSRYSFLIMAASLG